MVDGLLTQLGERVRTLREVQELTQPTLAERIGLQRSSIANLEAGRQNLPTTTLATLAAELSTSVGALLGEAPLPDLPPVRVAATYVVTCQRCGPLGEAATADGAYEQRRAHVRQHLTGAINREVPDA